MKISFPYEIKPSSIFGTIKRPVARVCFWSKKFNRYLEYLLIVDTGADYTLLPLSAAEELGIDPRKDCQPFKTAGIGGEETVYLLKRAEMKIGDWKGSIPIGFLAREDIPPLLGREGCLNEFDVRFFRFQTTFAPLN